MGDSLFGSNNSGVGAIDVMKIVDTMMEYKSMKLYQLETVKKVQQTQISAYGNLQNLFTTFQGSLTNLSSAFNTIVYSATSSNDNVVNATVTGNEIGAGTHTINVTALAASQVNTSGNVFTTNNSPLGYDETLTFTNNTTGATFNVPIGPTQTLQNIRDAINNSPTNIGVSAAIITSINDGVPQYNLVVTSDSGTANAVTISGDTNNYFNFSQTAAAADAAFTFDDYDEVTSSNAIEDGEVIDGLSFNLTGLGAATITVSPGEDTQSENVQTAMSTMLTAYNQIITFLDSARQVTITDDDHRISVTKYNDRFADIKQQLQAAVNTVFNGAGDIHTFHDAGITFSPNQNNIIDQYDVKKVVTSTGSLTLTPTPNQTTTFDWVLDNDFQALQEYFMNSTNGFIANVNNVINNNFLPQNTNGAPPVPPPGNGLPYVGEITDATNSIQDDEESIFKAIGAQKKYLAQTRENLIDQYSKLNATLSKFDTLNKYLEKQYAEFGKINYQRK